MIRSDQYTKFAGYITLLRGIGITNKFLLNLSLNLNAKAQCHYQPTHVKFSSLVRKLKQSKIFDEKRLSLREIIEILTCFGTDRVEMFLSFQVKKVQPSSDYRTTD